MSNVNGYNFKGMDVWNEKYVVANNGRPNVFSSNKKLSYKESITMREWAGIVDLARNSIEDEEQLDSHLKASIRSIYYIKDMDRFKIDTNRRYRVSAKREIAKVVSEHKDTLAPFLTEANKDIDLVVVAYKKKLIDKEALYYCLSDYIRYTAFSFSRSQFNGNGLAMESYLDEYGAIWIALEYLIDRYDNRSDGFISYSNKYIRYIVYDKSNKRSYSKMKDIIGKCDVRMTYSSSDIGFEMQELIDRLPSTHKIIVEKWIIDGYTRDEVSEMIGLSGGKVSSMKEEAITMLRKMYLDRQDVANSFGFQCLNDNIADKEMNVTEIEGGY